MSTLILYTSKTGVTKDVALLIEKQLIDQGIAVLTMDIKSYPLLSMDPFDTVVFGAPMYMGHYPKPIRKFIYKHLVNLTTKNLFMFLVGIDSQMDIDKYLAHSFPKQFINHLNTPVHVGGEVRKEKMPLLKRYVFDQVIKDSVFLNTDNIELNQANITAFINQVKMSLREEEGEYDCH